MSSPESPASGLAVEGEAVAFLRSDDVSNSMLKSRFELDVLEPEASPHPIRGRCYCVKNLYATTSATMLAKISSAGRDFRIIGLWRAADRPG